MGLAKKLPKPAAIHGVGKWPTASQDEFFTVLKNITICGGFN